jgi:hypothetical protein
VVWPDPFDRGQATRRWAHGAFSLWLVTFAAIARAQDPVLARVLSIETDRVTLSVQDHETGETSRVSVAIDRADLPPDLEPDRLVRLWPGSASGPTGLSTGARLEPLDRGMTESDRTGVRSRLMHGTERSAGGRRGGR